jgi:type II secretory pathway pseudopilin PulG
MRKQQQGFTLTEILLVVGFIALASVLVVRLATNAGVSSTASTEGQNIHALAQAVWRGPGMWGFYPYVSNTAMNASNLTPGNMRDASNANRIVNGFGSDINVTPATYVAFGITYPGFNIATTNIPFNYCPAIVVDEQSDFDQGEISVQGTLVKTVGGSLDVQALANACESASTVTITFTSFS